MDLQGLDTQDLDIVPDDMFVEQTPERDLQSEINKNIREAEESVKAVWEIDGTTVYVTDITIDKKKLIVDWFTLVDVDKVSMGAKVEDLAKILMKDQESNECQSKTRFSRILSTMKNFFGSRGLT